MDLREVELAELAKQYLREQMLPDLGLDDPFASTPPPVAPPGVPGLTYAPGSEVARSRSTLS